jgi:hypothetical protein
MIDYYNSKLADSQNEHAKLKAKDDNEKKAERIRKIVQDETQPYRASYGSMATANSEGLIRTAKLLGWKKAAAQSDDSFLKQVANVPGNTVGMRDILKKMALDENVSGIAREYAMERLTDDATLK